MHSSLFVLVAILICAAVSQGPAPTALRVQGSADPIAVDSPPAFSVGIDGSKDTAHWGANVTFVQVQVSVTAWGGGAARVVWDSGKMVVGSPAQLQWIQYAGEPLAVDALYTWQARVWTDTGGDDAPSAYGVGPSFRSGLLSEAGWSDSEWVGNGATNRSDPASSASQLVFDLDVAVPDGSSVEHATCFMSGLGAYAAWVGGVRIKGDEVHAAVSEWRNRTLYDAFDCTEGVMAGL